MKIKKHGWGFDSFMVLVLLGAVFGWAWAMSDKGGGDRQDCIETGDACNFRVWTGEECLWFEMPDGEHCRHVSNKFCVLQCTCEHGQVREELRDCDDNNPCTHDVCGWRESLFTWEIKPADHCLNTAANNGSPCGDGAGTCYDGFCLDSSDEVTSSGERLIER